MRFAFYMNIVSPHQLPLAHALVRLVGADNFRYVAQESVHAERASLGWGTASADWILSAAERPEEARAWLASCDLLVSGFRDLDLFERRCASGRTTCYTGERWFKPPVGRLRMFVPGFRRMAKRFVRLLTTSPSFHALPIGVHAARDLAWLLGAQVTDFDAVPMGRVNGAGAGLGKLRLWGYFVDPGRADEADRAWNSEGPVRVLWVGRYLKLKHVDDIVRAVAAANRARPGGFVLDLYGQGPDEARIRACAADCSFASFHPPVPIAEVRRLMRTHDVYAFASDGYEGWGAVVSEALEEGMCVFASEACGAGATLLPPAQRFRCGDWRRLTRLLLDFARPAVRTASIGPWTAERAARELVALAEECRHA